MRIRTIKPEFFKHEELYTLESSTGLPIRLAYTGLWCAADREGRFQWRPRRLGVEILPYDQVDFASVLDALCAAGFIKKYQVNGEDYGVIPTFKNHQCINIREAQSRLPEPGISKEDGNAHARMWNACDTEGVNIPPAIRREVFARDGLKCCRCDRTEELTLDHIFPQNIGGTHAPTNLRPMCNSCNSARPVNGQGLIDDLKRDGFTLEDMERMCAHVQTHVTPVNASGEGKGKEHGKEGNMYVHAPNSESEFSQSSPAALAEKIVAAYPRPGGNPYAAQQAVVQAIESGTDGSWIRACVEIHAARYKALPPEAKQYCPGKEAYFTGHQWTSDPDGPPWKHFPKEKKPLSTMENFQVISHDL